MLKILIGKFVVHVKIHPSNLYKNYTTSYMYVKVRYSLKIGNRFKTTHQNFVLILLIYYLY